MPWGPVKDARPREVSCAGCVCRSMRRRGTNALPPYRRIVILQRNYEHAHQKEIRRQADGHPSRIGNRVVEGIPRRMEGNRRDRGGLRDAPRRPDFRGRRSEKGTQNIISLCREAGIPAPEFEETGSSFIVRFRRSEKMRTEAGPQATEQVTPKSPPKSPPKSSRG